MIILAIDPATKCGWAHSSGISGVWDLSIRRDESAGMRLIRLRSKLEAIQKAGKPHLIIFEAARHSAPKMQGALCVAAKIQGQVEVFCLDNDIEFRGYSPSEIKKHATGKGNANKAKVLEAARTRWPDRAIEDDNEADAMWLLDLAEGEYSSEASNVDID